MQLNTFLKEFMSVKQIISDDLRVPLSLIDDSIASARKHVKKILIKKADGSYRTVYQPSVKLKTIQYWLIHNIFNQISIHSASLAYIKDKSILDNAILHKNSRFFLKIDLKDFFNSIEFNDLIKRVDIWHESFSTRWKYDHELKELIRLSCFYKDNRLAIGYPSSPIISNIVMYDFDTKVIEAISDVSRFGKVVYTRYADDMIFSTDKVGASNDLLKLITKIISECKSPNIQINSAKTRLASSSGGSASVTGLKICPNGHITVHRNQKDHVRLLLSLYRKHKLDKGEVASLLGHLSYIRHVDASFYTKLHQRYFKEINEMRALQSIN